ncbi:MAG: DUF2975 domain-containing protein [Bacteroidia bacterium]
METNRTIQMAIWVTNGVMLLFILFFAGFAGILLHWHINPEAYCNVEISSGFKAGFGIQDIRINKENLSADSLSLSQLSHVMVYWLLLRSSLFFILSLAIILRIKKILHSIRTIHTFYDENIRHFKVMGKWALAAFGLSCFNFYYQNGDFDLNFTIAFAPLLFSVACFVMKEIFTEGKNLLEDKNLIV